MFVEDDAGIAIHERGRDWLVVEEKFSVLVEGIVAWRGRGVIKFSGFSGTPWPDGMWGWSYPGSWIEALWRWKLRSWDWYVCISALFDFDNFALAF